MSRLPATLDELRGLRAARWVRESTKGQADNFGPDAQRRQQDLAIERHGLHDTGIVYDVAHSGRTVSATPEWAAMLAAAGASWDVLVVGYVSRFARDLETAVTARRALHAAGAVIVFADDRILTSDEEQWERWAREAVEAEAYSRRLSRRVKEGFAAKRRRERDHGSGETSFGFRRVRGLTEPDPATMPTAIEIYRLAADGVVDAEVAAATGVSLWRVRTVLRSPLYAGRLDDGTEARFLAPVPLELVEAAWAQRARRSTSGHQHRRHRIYPLSDRGPLVCAGCDRPLKGITRVPSGIRSYRHPDRCEAWTRQEQAADELERQVGWMLAHARPNRETLPLLRAALRSPVESPDRLALARVDAEMRKVALSLLERPDPTVVERLEQLRSQRAAIAATPVVADQPEPDEAIDWLASLGELWRQTSDAGRRALAVATFARLGALDHRIVDVEPTPMAERRGLVLALQPHVTVVGGTGEHRRAVTWPLRIAGRSAWLRAARSA